MQDFEEALKGHTLLKVKREMLKNFYSKKLLD